MSREETQALVAAARAWQAQDPDPVTRAEVDALLARVAGTATDASASDREQASAELRDRFQTRLQFGTAGLRGELGAGPNRMNRVLVAQAAAGFADYLRSRSPRPSIVVGYDGRHNSRVFAEDTARIMAGAGVRTVLLPRALPTPLLAYAVKHLAVSAGVMVTASHNPARDNGYKVYLGDEDHGAQIVSPADRDIAAFIHKAAGERTVQQLPVADDYEIAPESLVDSYVREVADLFAAPLAPLTWVYTPLHGVGWETAARVFDAVGVDRPIVVAAQADPDPDFPTVAFPNPEEPGALDLAFQAAIAADAELIIANDPDADRLAVAIADEHGAWRRLSGNEVGMLLGLGIAERYTADGNTGTFASSLVSSPALEVVARELGFGYRETLTGFKWISRAPDIVYGYEEALGYLVAPWITSDKDGISAAVAVLHGVLLLKSRGQTIDDYDREFAERFGSFASDQISVRVTDLAVIPRIMAKLRQDPPTRIGSRAVERMDDLVDGFGDLPPSDVLRFHLGDGARLIVRPSGTEPKVKVYLDAQSTEGTVAERRDAARAIIADLAEAVPHLLEV
ncbi:phospho-sugar mutase [Clavibacter tessellarius]|uniref:Phosphomannomutase n=1 Tax=Clavibacter tessellarius TaxID=31965 RepID=A0A154V0N6_9MICO|nr:phospho-sugar mutase [Clavibacter michiganensis]KZC94931.1 phosphomannomutase [Clavibacter michiganensis subsp. tessellarius]